jgi:peptidoglycan/xylan/chitin deacetylase (PgdA/CDA1 family)/SAM-dependent methyltransferase
VSLCVVIPAHNAADTLAETLDSLLAQTRGDWTAIIVDDGSTDGTCALAETYVARDPRFRLLSDGRPCEGASAARNRGIAVADGRWLAFLDADDWLDRRFVDKMVGTIESRPGQKVIYCASRRVAFDGGIGQSWLSTDVVRAPFEVFARQCPVAIHAFVLDRAMIVELGGFDAALRTCEDWDLWQRVARTGTPFVSVAEPLAIYRARRDSLSSDLGAMLQNARIVIGRGFTNDPRVATPAPAHAAGADPGRGGTRDMAIDQFALWCTAVQVAEGSDAAELPDLSLNHWDGQIEAWRMTIWRGLVDGARAYADGRLPSDPAFLEAVRSLLRRVEEAAGRLGLARSLEFTLEPEVFRPQHLTERLAVGGTLHIRQDIRALRPVRVPDTVDCLSVEFRDDSGSLARAELPVFGTLPPRALMASAIEAMSPTVFLRRSGLLRRPAFWLHASLAAPWLAIEVTRARLAGRRLPAPRRVVRKLLVDAALATASAEVENASDAGLATAIAEGRAQAATRSAARTELTAPSSPPLAALPQAAERRKYWDALYRTNDPMSYASDYEQLKYRRTLSLLPEASIGRALEVACSEGMFTALLAPRVDQLTACDISRNALSRARERCAAFTNVEYWCADFFDDDLPDNLDLLVCSEVLYYLPGRTELQRVVAKLAAALAPGGRLLTAHAKELKDDPSRTGFDWDGPFGVEVISRTIAATPGLALERSIDTDLYRIELWRRLAPAEPRPEPRREAIELGPPPEPRHARSVVWGGAVMRRAEARAHEQTERLPILLYHRIAEEGPAALARYRTPPAALAAQMRWLRRHGFHSVHSSDVAEHLASGRPFPGRPVLISFDDGYRDFYDAAWPILLAHDFSAEVFVVTDLVGETAGWDAEHGPPAPLMDWTQIQDLADQGVRFGSHMASHSHMSELSNRQIVHEAARSRAALERALAQECLAIAAPFGEASQRFVDLAGKIGFRAGFTIEPGLAHLSSDPLRLPRLEVQGGMSLEAFAAAVTGGAPMGGATA